MSARSEQEFPDYPLSVSVDEFLNSLPDVTGSVQSFQRYQREHDGFDIPTDLAFAQTLALVGRAHIKSIMRNYPPLTMAQYQNLRPEHHESYAKNITAIVIGLAYESIDSFLCYPDANAEGEYVFDSSNFATVFDNFMSGTGIQISDLEGLETTYGNLYNQTRWEALIDEAKANGVASAFYAKLYLIPNMFGDLSTKLWGRPYLEPTARTFNEILALIESEEDKKKRIDRASQYAQPPEEQSPEQEERDTELRRLLGGIPGFSPKISPEVEPPEHPGRWNDDDWALGQTIRLFLGKDDD